MSHGSSAIESVKFTKTSGQSDLAPRYLDLEPLLLWQWRFDRVSSPPPKVTVALTPLR